MDPKLSFAQLTALNEVEACRDMQALKAVTKNLVQAYFGQRHFIEHLMAQSLTAPCLVNASAQYEHGEDDGTPW